MAFHILILIYFNLNFILFYFIVKPEGDIFWLEVIWESWGNFDLCYFGGQISSIWKGTW